VGNDGEKYEILVEERKIVDDVKLCIVSISKNRLLYTRYNYEEKKEKDNRLSCAGVREGGCNFINIKYKGLEADF